jgi:hypothetical protein
MSKVLFISFLAGWSLFGHDYATVNRLSTTDREAVRTQYPSVKTQGMKKHAKDNKKSVLPGYRVVSDKSTIDAYVPVGK